MLCAIYNYPNCGSMIGASIIKDAGLVLGKKYEVEKVDMCPYHTYIYLKRFEPCFNSINFDFEEDGKEINLYNDKRYNPYA